ncbi:MAG: DUF1634 domain-containing protein [Clostridium sp.]|jgi:uncharacterized membrane protein|uniref:DUF1634 domain-containing protein n=1 Tax=Clostridium sp. TaxID=1506 RepID=UPI0025C027B8|nr:DUF1634 domain-containing protein [Clostridium sp.]MCH3964786.1 DUF1634 domain-containing protein [Clostridium sp.]MCI1715257.1 DUF1634 domain-containing protein [Clostridium sp.]MCI1799519.1 DUF1634 domain-containing protein [Clostridium sp.]MCI1813440.1 DUF1634 domain-containing protein [Clostridium sp.]MCI1870331.1 DUF1634 domain-containing protein [Clostridium sp.]
MNDKKLKENTREMEKIISTFLFVGVLTSSAVIIIGLIMFLISGSSGYPGNFYPTYPFEILHGCMALKPYSIILLGLMLLIAIPIFRVGISILVFFKEKDFLYVKITAVVFIILIISLFMGKN